MARESQSKKTVDEATAWIKRIIISLYGFATSKRRYALRTIPPRHFGGLNGMNNKIKKCSNFHTKIDEGTVFYRADCGNIYCRKCFDKCVGRPIT